PIGQFARREELTRLRRIDRLHHARSVNEDALSLLQFLSRSGGRVGRRVVKLHLSLKDMDSGLLVADVQREFGSTIDQVYLRRSDPEFLGLGGDDGAEFPARAVAFHSRDKAELRRPLKDHRRAAIELDLRVSGFEYHAAGPERSAGAGRQTRLFPVGMMS